MPIGDSDEENGPPSEKKNMMAPMPIVECIDVPGDMPAPVKTVGAERHSVLPVVQTFEFPQLAPGPLHK